MIYVDTDDDGLSDYDETNVYNTNPLKKDTDDDGVSDAKEIELGTDSSVYEETFYTVVEAEEEDTVKVSVETNLSGEQVESLTVERYENEFLFPTDMPGYIGGAYDFSVDGELGSATIKFEFDESLLTADDFEPVIYYFDEENQVLEELTTTINGNVASAEVTHFSKYIMINRASYKQAFKWRSTNIISEYSGLDVYFMLEKSHSIMGSDSEKAIKDAGWKIIDMLPYGNRLSYAFFGNKCCCFGVDYRNIDEVKERIAFMPALTAEYEDINNFYYILERALWMFRNPEDDVLRVMLVFTDDSPQYTKDTPKIIKKAKDRNMIIYVVEYGNACVQRRHDKQLQYVVDETGGEIFFADEIDELYETIEKIEINIDTITDSDNDGIADYYEDNLVMFNGVTLKLDKNNDDTDGDGLSDGEEVDDLIFQYNADKSKVLVTAHLLSNPLEGDSDIDGISDEEEVIIGTSQFNIDSDDDGLLDGTEYVEGFDPLVADADGDGRYDWREHLEGTDPYVYNKDWNEYVWEFTCGVIAGDFIADSDSMATTAGQVIGSFVPGVDVRDVIGNCVHEDYLMASVSFAGLIPATGDVAKALAKVSKYAVKNMDNVPKIVELLEFLNKHCPDVVKALGKSDDFIDVAKQLSKADNLKLTRAQRKILTETFENAGLSHHLLKTANLDGLKDLVDIGEDVWTKGACERGRIIDIYINKHDGIEGLGVNFPVADRVFDRTLVSTKSLDVAAQSYQNPNKLRNMLNKYANDLKNIETKYFDEQGELKWGSGKALSVEDYDKKALEIVLPDTVITEKILTELNSFKGEMDKAGIEIWYRITK